MNNTLLVVGLLLVLLLAAILIARQMRRQTRREPPGDSQLHFRPDRWEGDQADYREAGWAMQRRHGHLSVFAGMAIRQASELAARDASQQVWEATGDSEAAREAGLAAYRETAEALASAEERRLAWHNRAWQLDAPAYRAVDTALDDGHGGILLHSQDAVCRVRQASIEAAIQAFQEAIDGGLDDTDSRQAALEGYRKTFETVLAAERHRESDASYVSRQLMALSPEQVRRIEQRMQAGGESAMCPSGVLSVSGFLQPGERLIEVIEQDERTLAELGIAPEQIADRLETLVGTARRIVDLVRRGRLELDDEAMAELAEEPIKVQVSERFALKITAYRGSQGCPFEDPEGQSCHCAGFGDVDFSLENTQTRAVLDFPGLIIHLIREHHFFEGAVPYRVDPRTAVEVLELQPGVDYRPSYGRESLWRWNEGTANTSAEALQSYPHLQSLKDNPETAIVLEEGISVYARADSCLTLAERDYPVPADFTVDGAIWARDEITRGTFGYRRSEEIFLR